jgi:hypothetical protein
VPVLKAEEKSAMPTPSGAEGLVWLALLTIGLFRCDVTRRARLRSRARPAQRPTRSELERKRLAPAIAASRAPCTHVLAPVSAVPNCHPPALNVLSSEPTPTLAS